jgi:hypothetical protein
MSLPASDDAAFIGRVRNYLATRMPEAPDLELRAVNRIAVGWSHETWLFDATWQEAGRVRTRGMCIRRDPGNTLLRHCRTCTRSSAYSSALSRLPCRHRRRTGSSPIPGFSARRSS